MYKKLFSLNYIIFEYYLIGEKIKYVNVLGRIAKS